MRTYPPKRQPSYAGGGHDALPVWDQNLRGRPDHEVAEACRRESRAFVTLDTGFPDIRRYPPGEHSGLIVLRLREQSRKHVLTILERVERLLISEPLAHSLWVVDERSVRIRRVPAEEK